ncbi:hypothetical protein AB205_0099780 [Aquarana catesbeiana]|uniref:Uncharacterized protein n=1 Tax=Aquarana catesbeiana TaxID=8400 RepID=A0A2G9QGQ7_AQUCT|nr:hypothetical protein AB205_0099780 [Aquarana catesbeiana]
MCETLPKKGRKLSGRQRTPGTPKLLKKGKSQNHNLRMWRKERFMKWGNIDVDVVEEESHFTSASAHVLIWEIMVCNWDLQKIKEDINDVEKRLKNIIDVLGRI